MRYQPLTYEHKDLLFERLKNIHTDLSEYSFSNLYLFRKTHDYAILQDKEIFIVGKTYEGKSFLMPTKDIRSMDYEYLMTVSRDFDFLFPVPEEWLGFFETKPVRKKFVDGDSDYIYTLEKMATYQGTKLHSKKNLLNQFLSLYVPQAKPLTQKLMPDAFRILEHWQEDSGNAKSTTDYYACHEALAMYDDLVLCGGIYYVGREPAGFVIGEEINPSMFALHFVKGIREYKGIYQYMYNHFANILPKKYLYLNFEQDLGIPALKIAKTSYHPDKILKKYRISLR